MMMCQMLRHVKLILIRWCQISNVQSVFYYWRCFGAACTFEAAPSNLLFSQIMH